MDSVNLNIQLSIDQLLVAVRQLSAKDKLKLSDAIWDDITEIPQEHQDVVMSRIKASSEDPDRLLDWNSVMKSL